MYQNIFVIEKIFYELCFLTENTKPFVEFAHKIYIHTLAMSKQIGHLDYKSIIFLQSLVLFAILLNEGGPNKQSNHYLFHIVRHNQQELRYVCSFKKSLKFRHFSYIDELLLVVGPYSSTMSSVIKSSSSSKFDP